MTNPTPRDSAQPLRDLTDDEKQLLHYNPNTSDLVEFVQAYAREALRAQAASVEPVGWRHKDGHTQWRAPEWAPGIAEKYTAERGWTPLYAGAPPAHIPADAPQPQAVAASSPATAVDAVDERQLFECIACNHLYSEKVSQCDCLENPTNAYTEWVATPRAALQASHQPVTQQGGGEVVAWQSADGGGSFVSHQAHEQHRGYRTLYTIPLVRAGQVAAPAMVPLQPLSKGDMERVWYQEEGVRHGYGPLMNKAIAEFCRINGLTVGGSKDEGDK